MNTKLFFPAIGAALVFGLVFGAVASQDESPAAAATKTVSVPGPTVTKTETVEVVKTNPACMAALEKADRVMELAASGFTAISDGFTAMSEGDIVGGMQGMTTKLKDLSPEMREARSQYDEAKADCSGPTA